MSKLRICLLFLAMLMISVSCGGGSGEGQETVTVPLASSDGRSEVGDSCDGAQPMPPDLSGTWNETSQCAALWGPPPSVLFSPTVNCPRSGEPNCLATVAFFPCSDDASQTCGAIGRFLPECNAIELPDHYSGAAAHEMIHYLLYQNHRSDWAGHSSSEWVCQ